MKILFIVNHDIVIYNFRLEIVESFLAAGHEVHISSPYGERINDLIRLGAKFHEISMSRHGVNLFHEWKLLKDYCKLMKMLQPDIVLGFTIKPNIYGAVAARKYSIPFVANITGLGTSIENGGLRRRISLVLYKWGLLSAKCVFFQNAVNRKFFLDNMIVKEEQARLIPGSGVNLETFPIEHYPSEQGGIRFLFVGRIMRDKGIGELLQAITALHHECPQVTLDIVGFIEEPYWEELIQNAVQIGGVRYHGAQRDVRPFYRDCHCIVLPSYHEGMANVLLEASATGRPVIATRVPGCQEIFDEDMTGLGCEPKNATSLLEAMRKFLSLSTEQRKSMGLAARTKMVRQFDRRLVVQAYSKAVNSTLGYIS